MLDFDLNVLDSEPWILGTEFETILNRILNYFHDFWILDSVFWALNSAFFILDCGHFCSKYDRLDPLLGS